MVDQALIDVFKSEASEILENIENDLVALEENPDEEVINRLFRYFHTLKGSSGITGLDEISEFTHHLENILDSVRGGNIAVDRPMIDLLLGSVDWVRSQVFNPEEGYDSAAQKDLLLNQIKKMKSAGSEKSSSPAVKAESARVDRYVRLKAHFREDIFLFGIDPLCIMEDFFAMGETVENNVHRESVPVLSEMDPEKCYINWIAVIKTQHTIKEIEDVFIFVKDDNDIEINDISESFSEAAAADDNRKIGDILLQKGIITEEQLEEVLGDQEHRNLKIGELVVKKGYATEKDLKNALGVQEEIRKKTEHSTVRVDTQKLDSLMNLLGEIVIGQSAITRFSERLDEEMAYELKNALYGLDRITREFQGQLMSIRMIPVGPLFNQFKRFVRDTSHGMGKDIILETKGVDTELDKTVIEKIGDPLKHMIRNSVDHGIETKEERLAAGKTENGTIILNAYHQEGHVYIEVIDDGRGLDYPRIIDKARRNGLLKPDEDVTEAQIVNLIFMPGFSTAETVGELSGRGVGMDVVKTNIESLRGSIDVKSEKGKGSVFRIKLPLTLAIIEGMLCKVGKSIYIIPLLSIVESVQPKKEDVRSVEGHGEVIFARGEYISLIRLFSYFDVEPEVRDPWDALVLIVESGGEKIALMIDDLIGQQQIVIKSLDSSITNHAAISGAAILGDGAVALILDIHGMLRDIMKMNNRVVRH